MAIAAPPIQNLFELTDVGDAIERYLENDVVVTLGEIDPAVSSSLQPGELGTFTVNVQNGAIPLENVWLHFTLEDPLRADYQVPSGAALVVQDDINGSALPRNTFVNEMWVKVTTGDLEADGTLDLTLTARAGSIGQTDIRCHVHADVPLSSFLPTALRGNNSITSVVVE